MRDQGWKDGGFSQRDRKSFAALYALRDADELYRYLTTTVGAITAIRQVEVSPVLRRIKQAGTIMDGDRLPNPTAA